MDNPLDFVFDNRNKKGSFVPGKVRLLSNVSSDVLSRYSTATASEDGLYVLEGVVSSLVRKCDSIHFRLKKLSTTPTLSGQQQHVVNCVIVEPQSLSFEATQIREGEKLMAYGFLAKNRMVVHWWKLFGFGAVTVNKQLNLGALSISQQSPAASPSVSQQRKGGEDNNNNNNNINNNNINNNNNNNDFNSKRGRSLSPKRRVESTFAKVKRDSPRAESAITKSLVSATAAAAAASLACAEAKRRSPRSSKSTSHRNNKKNVITQDEYLPITAAIPDERIEYPSDLTSFSTFAQIAATGVGKNADAPKPILHRHAAADAAMTSDHRLEHSIHNHGLHGKQHQSSHHNGEDLSMQKIQKLIQRAKDVERYVTFSGGQNYVDLTESVMRRYPAAVEVSGLESPPLSDDGMHEYGGAGSLLEELEFFRSRLEQEIERREQAESYAEKIVHDFIEARKQLDVAHNEIRQLKAERSTLCSVCEELQCQLSQYMKHAEELGDEENLPSISSIVAQTSEVAIPDDENKGNGCDSNSDNDNDSDEEEEEEEEEGETESESDSDGQEAVTKQQN